MHLLRRLWTVRALAVSLRTAHLAAFGFVVGGLGFHAPAEQFMLWLFLSLASGVGLILVELRENGTAWFFLIKGILVLVKLPVLLAVGLFAELRVPLLLLVIAIAAISSHMPGRYRHYSVLHHRVVEHAG